MRIDEQRIQVLAYQLWESEGRPHGEHVRHWEMAKKLAEAEASGSKKKTGTRRVRKASDAAESTEDSTDAVTPVAPKSAAKTPAAKRKSKVTKA